MKVILIKQDRNKMTEDFRININTAILCYSSDICMHST